MDYIRIEKLKIFAHHGVFKEEKINGQNFYVDADLYLDIHEAAVDDDLNKSVDYGDVAYFINDFLTGNIFDLIETASDRLSRALLLKYPLLSKVDITIHKPGAPVNLDFGDISINVSRKWNIAYVAVGTNMGDKELYIKNAIKALTENEFIKDVKTSKLIKTEPYGGVEQDDFLNGMIELKTVLTPYELLDLLHAIENDNGRVRTIHWGPRTLDLDIIFYEDYIIKTDNLIIPHIDMENRLFVLEPLMELCPQYLNPVNGKTVSAMYKELLSK